MLEVAEADSDFRITGLLYPPFSNYLSITPHAGRMAHSVIRTVKHKATIKQSLDETQPKVIIKSLPEK